jgi:hypothetical protein
MGQEEVIKFLEHTDKPMSAREVSEAMHESFDKVIKAMAKLLKYNEVGFVELDRLIANEHFGCKRKMKLYYNPKNFKNKSQEDIIRIRITLQ